MTTILMLLAIIVLLPIAAIIVLKVCMWLLSAFIYMVAISIGFTIAVVSFLFKLNGKRRRSNYIPH